MREHLCVSSLLLKGSFALSEYEPGYIDIDLAIVIRDDIDYTARFFRGFDGWIKMSLT